MNEAVRQDIANISKNGTSNDTPPANNNNQTTIDSSDSKVANPFYDPSLKKRHARAKIFKVFTLGSLFFSIAFLTFFLFDIFG